MIARHELTAWGQCPVDGAPDRYEITVRSSRVVMVEDILAAADGLLSKPIYQEAFTDQLASKLGAGVTTVCIHSGVKTTCDS